MTNIPKFRAWHVESKVMLDVIGLTFHPFLEIYCGENKYGDELLFTTDEVILMQSTGLHDKNGKEIFFDDVVNSQEFPFWNNSKVGRTNEGKLCTDKKNGFCSSWTAHDWNTKFEVIGNIHEKQGALK